MSGAFGTPTLLSELGSSRCALSCRSSVSDAAAHTSGFGPVASRKSPSIEAPSSPPSSSSLATIAVVSLRAICHLSHGVQLTSMLSSTGSWLDRHKNGSLWKQASFVEWIGSSGIAASPVQYRATVVGWWVDQVVEIDDSEATPKSETLLNTLSHILSGPTSLVGLGIGSVLSQLTSLIVQRAALGDADPLLPHLHSTVASLASSHIYYVDQLNDVVADIVDSIRNVKDGSGLAARLGRHERKRALRQLVGALRQVLVQAEKGDEQVKVAVPVKAAESRPPLNGDPEGTVRGNGALLGVGQAETANVGDHLDAMGRPVMTVAAAGRRSRISPEVFVDSLFLLTDGDATVRGDYQRALLVYVDKEMELPSTADDEPALDPSHEISQFYRDLHLAMYELATASSLAGVEATDLSLAGHHSPSTRNPTRASSRSSRRRSTSSRVPDGATTATAADYAALAAIVEAVQRRRSAEAVIEGAPVLVALEGQRFENDAQGAEKAQACCEVAARGLKALGEAWSIVDAQRTAEEVGCGLPLIRLELMVRFGRPSPACLPQSFRSSSRLDEPRPTSPLLPPLPRRSSPLQSSRPSFLRVLCRPWLAQVSPPLSTPRGRPRSLTSGVSSLLFRTVDQSLTCELTDTTLTASSYTNGGRSITNLGHSSQLRVVPGSTPERAGSFRAPSLADLQSSVGGRPRSVRTSATPSIASTSNGTIATGRSQRRTSRAKAEQMLDRLTASRGGSRASSLFLSA